MPPSIAAAKASVTTGEWGQVLREVFGEYRAPTGIHAKPRSTKRGSKRCGKASSKSPASSGAR